jgi:hypothetical protein
MLLNAFVSSSWLWCRQLLLLLLLDCCRTCRKSCWLVCSQGSCLQTR